jgi:hypothetical protein
MGKVMEQQVVLIIMDNHYHQMEVLMELIQTVQVIQVMELSLLL